MADRDYSNREIDRMFSEIMTALTRIEEQTLKTNGRVTKIELERAEERGQTKSFVAVLSTGISVIVGVSVAIFKDLIIK